MVAVMVVLVASGEAEGAPHVRTGLGAGAGVLLVEPSDWFRAGVLPTASLTASFGSQLIDELAIFVRLHVWLAWIVPLPAAELMFEYRPVERVSLAAGAGASIPGVLMVPVRLSFAIGDTTPDDSGARSSFHVGLEGCLTHIWRNSEPAGQVGLTFGYEWW